MATITVHLITAWSGHPTDEAPLCGATGDGVWKGRTIYPDYANCLPCLRVAVDRKIAGGTAPADGGTA